MMRLVMAVGILHRECVPAALQMLQKSWLKVHARAMFLNPSRSFTWLHPCLGDFGYQDKICCLFVKNVSPPVWVRPPLPWFFLYLFLSLDCFGVEALSCQKGGGYVLFERGSYM